jgi:cobalt-zinc-cadmium efflux system membrane fusion protein
MGDESVTPRESVDSGAGSPAEGGLPRWTGKPWLVLGGIAILGLGWLLTEILGEGPHRSKGGVRTEAGALIIPAGATLLSYVETAVAGSEHALPAPAVMARIQVDDNRSIHVVAPVAGRVEQVMVELGGEVKPGDHLLAVRSATLPQLAQQIEMARAVLAVKRAELSRTRDLIRLGAIPAKDLLLAEHERYDAELALRVAEARRRSLRVDKVDHNGLHWMRASRAGVVVARQVLTGQQVGPDRKEPLLTIAMLDEVVVLADLFETDLMGVRPGQMVDLLPSRDDQKAMEGVVEYVSATFDPARRSVAVRVRVPNPGRVLRPNAFARVVFKEAGKGAHIIVPIEAVVRDGQQAVVFVREERSGLFRFARRSVRTGRAAEGRIEILAGLEKGESYAARGALLLLNAIDLGG